MPDTLARLDAVIERTARHKDAALLRVRSIMADEHHDRADYLEAHDHLTKWSRREARWRGVRMGIRNPPGPGHGQGKYKRGTHTHGKLRHRVAAALAAMDCGPCCE